MDNYNENPATLKQRHGCVTAWLIFIIIVNSVTALVYMFLSDKIAVNLPSGLPAAVQIILIVASIANVIFAIMLLKWKKLGFWGFTFTGIVAFITNLSLGLGVVQSIFGLAGIAILYGVLQIRQNSVKAWNHLE